MDVVRASHYKACDDLGVAPETRAEVEALLEECEKLLSGVSVFAHCCRRTLKFLVVSLLGLYEKILVVRTHLFWGVSASHIQKNESPASKCCVHFFAPERLAFILFCSVFKHSLRLSRTKK